MVVDAVTWVLCALARRHRGVVKEFIVDSAALHPLVRGQVDNWLRTGSRRNAAVHEWRIPQSTKLFPAGGPSSSGIPSEARRC